MSLPESLIIERLRLVRGVPQDEATTVAVVESRSVLRRQDRGILFILIDLMNEGAEDENLVQQLMDTTRRAFDQETGSITRRLRQAVLAANQRLLDWNQQRSDGRQAAGITCAALLGDEVYLAQAGPALAVVAQPGVADWFPQDSPWLAEEPLTSMPGGIWTPLGLRDDVYVALSFARIAPGYTLLLASAHLTQLLADDDVAELLDQEPEEVARDLTIVASGRSLSALVASILEEESVEIMPQPEPAPEPEPEPSGPGMVRRLVMAARRGVVVMGSAAAAVLGGGARILEALLPERVGALGSERRQRALMWVAILIPVALALLTVAMYWGRRGDRETRFLNLIQSASGRVEQARAVSETDPAQARELLQTASDELDRALQLRPDDASAARLRSDAQLQLDAMDGIARLGYVTVVASLPGRADNRRRLIVQSTSAFVLNGDEQTVHRVGLGDRRIAEVLKSGDSLDGRSVGPLVDMAWVPAGGVRDQGGVVVLDSAGALWQIDVVGNVTQLNVTGAENWRGLRLLGGFAGNLYVLDVGLGEILKYPPTADGYAIPPTEWLSANQSVELGDVVDMAIDGSIYLLRSTSRVEKLVAGEPVPFDQPDEFNLTQPVACFAVPPPGSVFLADATRILQFDTAGIFQRQLLPPQGRWQRLSTLWVDEPNGWLYAVDAGTLVMAALP